MNRLQNMEIQLHMTLMLFLVRHCSRYSEKDVNGEWSKDYHVTQRIVRRGEETTKDCGK